MRDNCPVNAKFAPYVRVGAAILIGAVLFVAGVATGESRRPEAEKVVGLINYLTNTDGSSSTLTELTTCFDPKGAAIPCAIDRAQVATSTDAPGDFTQFWKAWNVINERYVPTKEKTANNQEKVWGAIQGLAGSLGDPYTYFMPPAEKSIFEEDVKGNFGGVGMQVGMKDGIITVIAPLKGSPAERAGIKAGDRVLSIDNATTTEMTVDKAVYLIRGEVGTSVRLKLFREGTEEPFEITVTREVIQVPTIDTKMQDGVFIIQLYGFPATGAELFRQALREFAQSGTDKLVLDLRGNPGGYLEIAVDMASWFLPAGKVVVSEEERNGEGISYRSKGYNVFGDNFHFVILVDGGSASAAEILAGALGQHGVATLVGTKTFGKGSVQELIPITDDTALKLTIARWIMPNGTNLSDGGIDPDVVVEVTKEQAEKGEDPQLARAIEIVKSQGLPK